MSSHPQLELHSLAEFQHSDMAGGVSLSQPVICPACCQLFLNTEIMFNIQNKGSEDMQKAGRNSTIQSSKMGPTLTAYFTLHSTRGHRRTSKKDLWQSCPELASRLPFSLSLVIPRKTVLTHTQGARDAHPGEGRTAGQPTSDSRG